MARRRTTRPKIEYPTCVRHVKPRKDVRLRLYFLCDSCTRKWTIEAFDQNSPLWQSESVRGYCQLCNNIRSVRLRSWFLCDICDRVAGSIGRNHVAEKAIMDFWQEQVQSHHPHLVIEQNDVSALRPRRDTDVSGEGPLDFLVRDGRSGELLLGIENKTGRSSIRDMSAFQLDISDCDSILHHVRELNVPCYIVHVQVLEDWRPPTMGFRSVGLWWSDIFLMDEHFRDIRTRRDERRGAAYFSKKAFHEIETLPAALFTKSGKLALAEQFREEGVPSMYQLD